MRKLIAIFISFGFLIGFANSQLFDEAFNYNHSKRMLVLDSLATYQLKPNYKDSVDYFRELQLLTQKAISKHDQKSLLFADYLKFYFKVVHFTGSQNEIEKEYQYLFDKAVEMNVVTIMINLNLNMGYYYYEKPNPNYVLYFDYLNKAYLLYKDLDEKGCTDKSYNLYSMALAYYRFGDYWNSMKYSISVTNIPSTPDYVSMFNYNLLGVCYLKIGMNDSSRWFLKKTYDLALALKDKESFAGWEGIAIGNIGHTWYNDKEYDKAIENYTRAVDICSRVSLWDNVSPFSSNLINCYVIKNDLAEAGKIVPVAQHATYMYKNPIGYQLFYDALANYYLAKKDFEKAIIYRDSSILWNDSLQKTFDRNLKVRAELINYQQLSAVKQEKLNKEKKKQEMVTNAIVTLAFLIILIALLVYVRQTRVIKVRTLLLHEIHHRVKNNLQIISSILDIQQRSLNKPELKGVFNDARSRINSMALVHQNLYEKENLEFTDAQQYFEQLVKIITASYSTNQVEVKHNIFAHGVKLNLDTLIPVALIFNELLTNSYKYAFVGKKSGHVFFELKKSQEGFMMIFKDDGNGFPEGYDFKKSSGLGSLMIQQLTQQLFGKFTINSSLRGTEFSFIFKGL